MLTLPKSPNSVIDEMFRIKKQRKQGLFSRSSRSLPSRNRSYSPDGSKSTLTMSSGGPSYKSVRSDADFRSTKSLSMSLREFRHRRRSRATKTTVRQTKGLELWDVCETGRDLAYLEHTIRLYPGLIHLEQRGRTPLFLACTNGHATMAARLLEAGALADEEIYQATQDAKCRALLEEYRVVERALSLTSSKKPQNEEEESFETPQMQNLSSCRNAVSLPKSTTIVEEVADDFFDTNADFTACSPFGDVVKNDEPAEETEEEMQFWMTRMMKHQTSNAHSTQATEMTSVTPEIPEPPTLERQKSLLSIAPSEHSDPPVEKDIDIDANVNADDGEQHCNCSFVECPGVRSDSPVQDEVLENEVSGSMISSANRSLLNADLLGDSAETPVEMEVSKIPEVLPNSPSNPRRLLFLDEEDDGDSPAAAPASSSSYSSTTRSSTRQFSKAPSATISFSSMESEDTESQQSSQIVTRKDVARQPPFVEDENTVEQAIECIFTPTGSNQSPRSRLSSWRPLRRNRRSSENACYLDDDDDLVADGDMVETDEVGEASPKRSGTVEMTLDDYTKDEATRLGLFQRMRRRSQLRRKVSRILDETDTDSRNLDDETSAFSSYTHSTFFHDDCCDDPHHCCF